MQPDPHNVTAPTSESLQSLDGFLSALRREERRWLLINSTIFAVAVIATAAVNGSIIGTLVWICGPAEHGVRWIYIVLLCTPLTILLFTLFDPIADPQSAPAEMLTADGHQWNVEERTLDFGPPFKATSYWSPHHPVLTQLLYIAPRQLRTSWRKLRASQTLRSISRPRAAKILHDLTQANHSASIHGLLLPGEPLPAIVPILSYLLLYDWIGISSDHHRIWLTTTNIAH